MALITIHTPGLMCFSLSRPIVEYIPMLIVPRWELQLGSWRSEVADSFITKVCHQELGCIGPSGWSAW